MDVPADLHLDGAQLAAVLPVDFYIAHFHQLVAFELEGHGFAEVIDPLISCLGQVFTVELHVLFILPSLIVFVGIYGRNYVLAPMTFHDSRSLVGANRQVTSRFLRYVLDRDVRNSVTFLVLHVES